MVWQLMRRLDCDCGVVMTKLGNPRESGHSAEKLVVVGENGVQRRGPGALVPRPSRVC